MDEQITSDQLAQDMRARAAAYSFLARTLSEDEVTLDFLRALRDDPPQTGTDLDGFARSLAGKDDQWLEEVRRELAADHAAILLGMSAAPVSPYESVYTSDLHLMMQEARDQVLAAYRAAGLAREDSYHVPEDHISLECDFMAALATRAADALEGEGPDLAAAQASVGAQQAFVRDHLARWVPALADDLERKARTPFYRGVAQMLRELVYQGAEV